MADLSTVAVVFSVSSSVRSDELSVSLGQSRVNDGAGGLPTICTKSAF